MGSAAAIGGVRLDRVAKAFVDARGREVRAVDGVSLEVPRGALCTLLGPSGCGKTTTLRMIAGFERPTAGEIWIAGERATDLPPHARKTPLVFQSYALFPHLSVRANASFGLERRGVAARDVRTRVEALAASMGLADLLDRSPGQLSGGQQQRVALLRALVLEPEVILFDEPLSNLDARLRVEMRSEIRRLQRRSGFTAVWVTHDQEEAMALSDQIVVMEAGRIAQAGPPAAVYARPASRFVATFLGGASFVPAVVVAEAPGGALEVEGPLGRLVVPGEARGPGVPVTLVLRPEAVHLGDAGVEARVRTVEYLGPEMRAEVEVGGAVIGARRLGAWAGLEEGSIVRVQVDARSIHLL